MAREGLFWFAVGGMALAVFCQQNSKAETPEPIVRSLVLSRDVPEGEVLRLGDLDLAAQTQGLPENQLARVVGKKTTRALLAGEPLQGGDVEWYRLMKPSFQRPRIASPKVEIWQEVADD